MCGGEGVCVCVCVFVYVCVCVCVCVTVCLSPPHTCTVPLSTHTLPLRHSHNIFNTPLIISPQTQRQEILKNKRSHIPNKMSDNSSQFGQKMTHSIYNPMKAENEIQKNECSTNNGDNGEENDGVKTKSRQSI